MGLDFISIGKGGQERYDLAIPAEHMETEMIQALLDVIRNDTEFKEAVETLGGYDTSRMGKTID